MEINYTKSYKNHYPEFDFIDEYFIIKVNWLNSNKLFTNFLKSLFKIGIKNHNLTKSGFNFVLLIFLP